MRDSEHDYHPAALAEIKKIIRSVHREKGRQAAAEALTASTPQQVVEILVSYLRDDLDLARFTGSWSLSGPS